MFAFTSTVAAAHDDGELGHVRACNGCDELGTVFGDTITLRLRAHHEAGDVLKEHQWNTTLRAELDKVCALDCRGSEEDTVVGHNAHLVTVNLGEASHESGAKVVLELGELGAVHNASNDLTDGERFSHGRVHLATSQILVADNLSCRGLDQRRASKENMTLLLDNDALVTHGWDVGTTSCAGTHDHSDLGDTLCAHACLVIEDATKVVLIGEDIGLMGEVGTTAVDEIDTSVCAALDGAVIGNNNACHALDSAHTSDDTTCGHFGLWIELMASHGRKLKECGSGVDQCRYAISGEHLLACNMLLSGLLRSSLLDLTGELLHAAHDLAHLPLILLELV
ncbi:hypothetical protein HG530_002420 [Fusarium avenaceum]|nr:hypothetical protein HG530_002420 [Fusarium avenaceum]